MVAAAIITCSRLDFYPFSGPRGDDGHADYIACFVQLMCVMKAFDQSGRRSVDKLSV